MRYLAHWLDFFLLVKLTRSDSTQLLHPLSHVSSFSFHFNQHYLNPLPVPISDYPILIVANPFPIRVPLFRFIKISNGWF